RLPGDGLDGHDREGGCADSRLCRGDRGFDRRRYVSGPEDRLPARRDTTTPADGRAAWRTDVGNLRLSFGAAARRDVRLWRHRASGPAGYVDEARHRGRPRPAASLGIRRDRHWHRARLRATEDSLAAICGRRLPSGVDDDAALHRRAAAGPLRAPRQNGSRGFGLSRARHSPWQRLCRRRRSSRGRHCRRCFCAEPQAGRHRHGMAGHARGSSARWAACFRILHRRLYPAGPAVSVMERLCWKTSALILLSALLLAGCANAPRNLPYPAFIQTEELDGTFHGGLPGTRAKCLGGDPSTGRFSALLLLPEQWRWNTGAAPGKSVEIFVLAGEVMLGDLALRPGNYAWLPPGSTGLSMSSLGGAQLLYFLNDAAPDAVIQTPLFMSREVVPWQPLTGDAMDAGLQVKE